MSWKKQTRWVRLIFGTADCATAEPVEAVEPTEPKEMTVSLQLPLAIKRDEIISCH